jgi:hypothetical protein
MPAELGRALLGSSWAGARVLFLPLTSCTRFLERRPPSLLGCDPSLLRRAASGCVWFNRSGGAAGAGIGGASAAIWELAAVYLLELLLWWWQFTEALRIESAATSEPSDEDRVGEETIVEVVGVTERGVGEGHG